MRKKSIVPEGALLRGKTWKFDSKTDTLTIPGLRDCHTHPFIYSLLRAANTVDISKCRSVAQMQESLRERKGTGLIFATGLDTNSLSHATRRCLDEASRDDVIIVIDPSFHGGVLNTKAAKIIEGKSRRGVFKGELTKEGTWKGVDYLYICLELASEKLDPDKLADEVRAWVREQQNRGVVEIHEMMVPSFLGLEIMQKAAEDYVGYFPVSRIYTRFDTLAFLISDKHTALSLAGLFEGIGLKMLADGSLGSRTAALQEPYCQSDSLGTVSHDLSYLRENLRRIRYRENPLPNDVAIHAIGDRGIMNALEMASYVKQKMGKKTRIEHFEVSGNTQILALAKDRLRHSELSFVLMNPNFISDYEEYSARLGERIGELNPLRSILESGIPMRFGTDGMPQDMLRAVYDAVYHPVKEHRLTLDQALQVASGVEKLEDARHVVNIQGPLLESLLFGKKYEGQCRVVVNDS